MIRSASTRLDPLTQRLARRRSGYACERALLARRVISRAPGRATGLRSCPRSGRCARRERTARGHPRRPPRPCCRRRRRQRALPRLADRLSHPRRPTAPHTDELTANRERRPHAAPAFTPGEAVRAETTRSCAPGPAPTLHTRKTLERSYAAARHRGQLAGRGWISLVKRQLAG